MADKRVAVRRIIQFLGISGAAVTNAVGGQFISEVAEAAAARLRGVAPEALPMLTAETLRWLPHLSTIGFVVAAIVVGGTVVTFVVSRNEDTRLQSTFALAVLGYAAATTMWSFVGVNLILLPHLTHVI